MYEIKHFHLSLALYLWTTTLLSACFPLPLFSWQGTSSHSLFRAIMGPAGSGTKQSSISALGLGGTKPKGGEAYAALLDDEEFRSGRSSLGMQSMASSILWRGVFVWLVQCCSRTSPNPHFASARRLSVGVKRYEPRGAEKITADNWKYRLIFCCGKEKSSM